MALSTRELLLVLRARDEASRVLKGFAGNMAALDAEAAAASRAQVTRGAAMATVGVIIAAAGVLGVKAFASMESAAEAYNKQVALTFTQVDKAGVSFEQLSAMGLKAATTYAVPLKDVQGTLYDIFSSIDTNAAGATALLDGIAQAAVAGNVSMEAAGRGAIGILNAYKEPATDINKVNDTMFQLVRKGVGTYAQFDSVIGRAVPSAIKAGQSFEDLGGMMAFLTRNGLSAAMASASAGRALDALANPKSIESFKNMGEIAQNTIKDAFGPAAVKQLEATGTNFDTMSQNMLDSSGKMKPVSKIMDDLNANLKGMTKAEKAAVMQQLFKGSGGTIQAMRFFNHAVNDTNDSLGALTDDMHHAQGASDAAFKVMKDTPANQVAILKNRWQVLRVEIGEKLIPIKMALVKVFSKILDVLTKINPKVMQYIVIFLGVAAVVAIVVGVIITLVGMWLMLAGAAALAGVSLGAIAAVIGIVILAFLAIAVAGYLIYKNWDMLSAKAKEVWAKVWAAIEPVVNYIKHDLVRAWQTAVAFFVGQAEKIWKGIQGPLKSAEASFMQMVDKIKLALQNFIKNAGDWGESFKHIWNGMVAVVRDVFWPVMQFLIKWFVNDFIAQFRTAMAFLKIVFGVIGDVLSAFIAEVAAVLKFLSDLINGRWGKLWGDALNIVKTMWAAIWAVIKGAVDLILGGINAFISDFINFFKSLFETIVGHSIVPDMINLIVWWFLQLPILILGKIWSFITTIVTYFAGLEGRLITAVAGIVGALARTAAGWITGMLGALYNGVGALLSWFGSLGGTILSMIGDPISMLYDAGTKIIQGLINGIGSMVGSLASTVGNAVKHGISDLLPGSPVRSGPLRVLNNGRTGKKIIGMIADGVTKHKGLLTGAMNDAMSMSTPIATFGVGNNNGTPPGAFPPPSGGAPGSNGGGGDQNFYITTQEIDPTKHAADLGWEIARRVG